LNFLEIFWIILKNQDFKTLNHFDMIMKDIRIKLVQWFRSWLWNNDYVKTLITPLCSSDCHNSCTADKQNQKLNVVKVNCPTKANTDLHNGDYNLSFLQSFCLLSSGFLNNAQSSLIDFNTLHC